MNDKIEKSIHPTHEMSEWIDTVVVITSTPRFGQIRSCIKCDSEHARTVCGEAIHEELKAECSG